MRAARPTTSLNGVSIDVSSPALLVPGALTILWATAGALAGTLPVPTSARAMRRRTLLLVALTTAAVAATGGALLAPAAYGGAGLALLGIASLAAATISLPRLRRLGSSAGAFAAAPVSPALRAMAAHPLVGTPLHAAGGAAFLALAAGTGLWRPDAVTAATLLALATAGAGVAHGLRHSRLAEPALMPTRPVRAVRLASVVRPPRSA
jgi:hypothetical protein